MLELDLYVPWVKCLHHLLNHKNEINACPFYANKETNKIHKSEMAATVVECTENNEWAN